MNAIAIGWAIGIVGSLHCVGMCSPLAFAILKSQSRSIWVKHTVYQIGKMTAYIVLGLIFGLFGYGFSLGNLQSWLTLFIGISLIIMHFVPSYQNRFSMTILTTLKNAVGKYIGSKKISGTYIFGFLNGLLPCGLVYVAIAGSMTYDTIYSSLLHIVGFGIGTVPLMSAAVFGQKFLDGRFRAISAKLVPYIGFITGLILVFRAMMIELPEYIPFYTSPDQITSCK